MIAFTRAVSSSIVDAELTFMGRQIIDVEKANLQHKAYEDYLRNLGVEVISLPIQDDMPDAVFVEDPAVVVDEIAIITAMGAPSRALEVESIINPLSAFRKIKRLTSPATLEGGDVLRIDRKIFVGLSTRTNATGIEQLAAILSGYSYEVIPVKVTGCLHLKTGCTYLGKNRILINSKWVDKNPFEGFEIIEVPGEEAFGANILLVNDKILIPAAFAKTRSILEELGFEVFAIDISELQKAEAGLTCMSIVFKK